MPAAQPKVVDGRVQYQVTLTDPADSPQAEDVVRQLRTNLDAVSPDALVGGGTAQNLDIRDISQADRNRVIPVILAVIFVVPAIRKTDATVSASEILARSASQLASVTRVVEVLEYELVLGGVPKQMIPDQADGTYRIWQAIDHDVPVRFIDLALTHVLADARPSADDQPALDPSADRPADPLALLAQAAGYDDAERWWDDVIEHRGDGPSPFEAIAEAMTALREHAPAMPAAYTRREERREAYMRR